MVETTRAAIAGGASIVQLRAPEWKKREICECARALLRITRAAGIPLVIDDHADVALAVRTLSAYFASDLRIEGADGFEVR